MAEEILLKYKADITDLQSKLVKIEAEQRKVQQSITKNQATATQGFKNMGTALAPLGAAIAGAFAVSQVIAFGRESVKAFQDAELSAKKLQTAVSVSGGLQEDFTKLLNQSKQLQSITIFNDEDIQNAQTVALQFGLTADEVSKLIPVISDFASATGQSMEAALGSVLRGVEGQGKGLKLFGVNVDAAGSRAENLGGILDQLGSKFAGQAEIIGKTGAGAIARYTNEIDELKEQLGEKLEPILLGVTEAALSFTEAIVFTTEAIGDLVDGIKAVGFGDFTGLIESQIKQLQTITQNARKDNDDLVLSFAESFKVLSDAQIIDRLNTYQGLLKKATEEQKALTDSGKGQSQQLNQDIVTYASASIALRKVTEDRLKAIEAQKLSEASLRKLTTAQLENLSLELAPKGDLLSRDAVEAIKKILEERKKAGAELAKQQAAENAARIAAQKKADDELLQLTIDNISDEFEKRREQSELDFNRFEKDKKEQLKQGLITQDAFNKLVEQAQKKHVAELAKITTEETETGNKEALDNRLKELDDFHNQEIVKLQQAFIEKGDFSVQAQEKLDADIAEQELKGLQERLATFRNAGLDTIALEGQIAAAQIDINKKKNDSLTKDDEEAAAKRIALISKIQENFELSAQAIQAVSGAVFGTQISNLEAQEEANQEHFDREQEQIDEQVEKRLITEAQGEKKSANLKKERAESEKKSNEEVKKLKRQQAEIDKALAIFRIGLQLAEAIAELNPFKIAAATVQLGVVIATPIPKFKAGAKWVERGRNAQGEDTIPAMLDEGERVVSRTKNIKHWDIYEAIDEGRLNQYVMKNFVAPALKDQQRKFEDNKQKTFADNIGQSIVTNGLSYQEAMRIRNKGIKITNYEEINKDQAAQIAKEVYRMMKYG